MLLLLTAPSGGGKSTFCQRVATAWQRQGFVVGGLLTRSSGPAGQAPALWWHDVARGDERLIAHLAPPADADWGRWRLLPTTEAWGNRRLRALHAVDLLLVDELGPWEMRAGRGLQAAWPVLRSAHYRLALLTVRPALAPALARTLADLRPVVLPLTDPDACSRARRLTQPPR